MVEWSITTVLKTVVLRGTGGSNPSLSAKEAIRKGCFFAFVLTICFHNLKAVLSFEIEYSCWALSVEDVHLEVYSYTDSALTQHHLYCLSGEHRMVVFLTEMT